MKSLKKVIGFCTIIIISIVMFSTNVMALDNPGEVTADTSNTGNITNVGNTIISTVRVLGMILSVGVLMVLGIKYMMGSAEEKADYKKTMIPYLVGAVLIFAATFIVGAIYEFASKV